jgi:hypothetical protein
MIMQKTGCYCSGFLDDFKVIVVRDLMADYRRVGCVYGRINDIYDHVPVIRAEMLGL